MADIGQCGECKTKPWVRGDFPPCEDSYCTFPYWVPDLNALHLRSHAEGVCRDHDVNTELYSYSLDILCLMALTESLGLEYGEFA